MNKYPSTFKALALAVSTALITLTVWELYLRSINYPVAPDDGKAIWAEQRAHIDDLDSTGVVLIGSSRVFFNIQIYDWEKMTGNRPVMLAIAGASPIPAFKDIVEKSSFAGTLIVGVTPPLYFSPMSNDLSFYQKTTEWVEHYHKRTYANRLNHLLSKFPQGNLAFLNATSENHYNQPDLRTLIERIPTPARVPGPPPFPFFEYIDINRNVTMLDRVSSDTSYARLITDFWSFAIQPPPDMPPPEVIEEMKNRNLQLNVDLVKKFEARGGKVIYIRNPSQGPFRQAENGGFPREAYWDKLISITGCKGYHFEDHPFMSIYTLPEWSHLATEDARQFTRDLVNRMQEDGVL